MKRAMIYCADGSLTLHPELVHPIEFVQMIQRAGGYWGDERIRKAKSFIPIYQIRMIEFREASAT